MTTSATLNEIRELLLIECNDNSLANRFISQLRRKFAGEMLYIPRDISGRNAEIRALFDGLNYRELAQAYDLTPRQIRVIVDGK